jgi:hypothetical protein
MPSGLPGGVAPITKPHEAGVAASDDQPVLNTIAEAELEAEAELAGEAELEAELEAESDTGSEARWLPSA